MTVATPGLPLGSAIYSSLVPSHWALDEPSALQGPYDNCGIGLPSVVRHFLYRALLTLSWDSDPLVKDEGVAPPISSKTMGVADRPSKGSRLPQLVLGVGGLDDRKAAGGVD
jgi:hypothetical protein